MATIHRTTMTPTKLELLAGWLPRQPWYRGTGRLPALTRVGGFRLDDPAGEVGIECIVVSDGTDGGATTYFVPLAYRGAPAAGAADGLVGTSEHGVLGTRWIYDAAHDPVAVAQLLALIGGRAEAQHQDESDTPDPSVGRHSAASERLVGGSPLRVEHTADGRTTIAVEPADGAPADRPRFLDLLRRPVPGAEHDPADGCVEIGWVRPDGGTARGRVAVLR
ncbi:1,4-alpha-glucan branching protein [Geodermatophilus sabuli]|uniref:1,4-alpha-glucan branching protein n=1 Tax=Geodermatophilus sabuli TaxID=1564158 RepID=A0A7K3W1Q9_9ACTN|nr:1,4-alpha-glucan branching protein [Geodermatophilus sabuli]NEK58829.1 1,4-alpha-glucan branching protein [Geodermatophilus sabuli]